MKIFVTKPQYGLIKKVLPIMASFYRNNFEPLFQLIEEDYGLPEGAAKDAAVIIHNIQITAPAYVMVLLISNYGSPTPHRYKVQYTPQGRPFVRPSGYRLYLDGMV